MKTVVLLAVTTLVAGCTLTASQQSAYSKACSGLRGAYAVYGEVRSEAPANVSFVVDQAYKSVNAFCITPPQDQTEAAVRITAASLTIWKAYRSVR